MPIDEHVYVGAQWKWCRLQKTQCSQLEPAMSEPEGEIRDKGPARSSQECRRDSCVNSDMKARGVTKVRSTKYEDCAGHVFGQDFSF
jgi:hypothetical protein